MQKTPCKELAFRLVVNILEIVKTEASYLLYCSFGA